MHWQAKVRQSLPRLVWIGLVLAIAAYGSVVVRNVTEALHGIVHPTSTMALAVQPSR
jgi:hypothetical protein